MRLLFALLFGVMVWGIPSHSSDLQLQKLWSYPVLYEDLGLPVLHGESVYFAPGNGELHAINLKSGKALWENKLSLGHSIRSLLATEKILYFYGSHDHLYAVDSASGELIWKRRLPEGGWGSLVFFDDKVYAIGYDRSLYCLNTKSGELLWKYRADSRLLDPLVVAEHLVLVESKGKIVHLDYRSGDLVRERQMNREFVKALAVGQSGIIGASKDGLITAMSLNTGKINWEFQSIGKLTIAGRAALAVDGNLVVVGNFEHSPSGSFTGASSMYALDTATGAMLWKFDASSSFVTAPAFSDQHVIAHNRNKTYYFCSKKDGKKVFQLASESREALPPVYSKGFLFIEQGLKLICYKLPQKDSLKGLTTSN